MTDRELLELAAKAAGIEYETDGFIKGTNRNKFNPLTDDGDALRLAVKFRLCAGFAYGGDKHPDWSYGYCGVTQVPFNGDEAATVRLAIVRAVAAIGMAMKEQVK